MSQHHMDHGQAINFDIEEKQMNFGYNLVEQELLSYNEELLFCKQESLEELLKSNLADFKALYQYHMDEIDRELASIDEAAATKI